MRIIMLLFVISSYLSVVSAQDFGTKGNDFWLGYLENLSLTMNGSPQFSIYVSATESGNATVSVPATGASFPFSYTANEVTEYVLPAAIFYASGSESIENFGLRINTSTETNVFTIHHRIYFTEASIVLPIDLLGDEYLISAVLDYENGGDSPSSFVIVATEDNTEIEIIPSALTASLRPSGIPFTVLLDEGQSYQVQSLGDLSGTKVKSTGGTKIAVFGGAKRGNIGCDQSADNHLYDQLYPLDYAAESYVLIPFKEQGYSVFKVVAIENNTQIFINDVLTLSLQEGEFAELSYDTPKILSSNKGVFVSQLNPSQGCNLSGIGDPSMLQLHSMDYRLKSMRFENILGFSAAPNGFSKQCLSLFTETENIDNVLVDNVNVSSEFQEFPGYPNYSYALLTLAVGSSKLEAPEGVLAYAYGFGSFDAYTYSLGFDEVEPLAVLNLETTFTVEIAPNPSADIVQIYSSEEIDQVDLYDVEGKRLSSTYPNSKNTMIDLNDYANGVYFIRLKSGDAVRSQRVVKLAK